MIDQGPQVRWEDIHMVEAMDAGTHVTEVGMECLLDPKNVFFSRSIAFVLPNRLSSSSAVSILLDFLIWSTSEHDFVIICCFNLMIFLQPVHKSMRYM